MDPGADQDRCRYFESLFSPYIDGSLDPPERKALADHLHECETCAERFGLSWREVTAKVAGEARARPRRSRRRGRSNGLWVLALVSLMGVAALGAMGLLDSAEGGGDLFKRRERSLLGEEIARMVDVQTELLKAVVGPLRGSEQHVSHTAKGQALDFFAHYASVREEPAATGEEPEWKSLFHDLFRASDPAPGGRDWDRSEFLASLGVSPPPVVLVRVVSAYRQVVFCEITWGERPAFAWLVRERTSENEQSEEEDAPFRLTLLVLSQP